MSILNILVQLLIVGTSIYLLNKTQKPEAWLLTIGAVVNFLASLFYTIAFQSGFIDFNSFPMKIVDGVHAFFYLLFAVGFLLTATRLVKEREALLRNDFQKRQ